MEQNNLKHIKKILSEVSDELSKEELIAMLISHKVSKPDHQPPLSMGDKMADLLARFAGSWKFIIIFSVIIAVWMTYNILVAIPFDPYPFILLNLMLSSLAAIQAPIIMMSQNRQSDIDRKQAENDYHVNLKAEILVETIYQQLQEILANQKQIIAQQTINKSDSQ
jgi:uncharacterized membrane protein